VASRVEQRQRLVADLRDELLAERVYGAAGSEYALIETAPLAARRAARDQHAVRLEVREGGPLLAACGRERLGCSVEHAAGVVGREHHRHRSARHPQQHRTFTMTLAQALETAHGPAIGVEPIQKALNPGPADDRPASEERDRDVRQEPRRLERGRPRDRLWAQVRLPSCRPRTPKARR
jgi:hypothetical protein